MPYEIGEIEKGVPVPTTNQGGGRVMQQLIKMDIGDSYLVTGDTSTMAIRATISYAIKRRLKDRAFKVKKLSPTSWRVWRTK